MSLTKCKDIDICILKLLSDKDLFSMLNVNKYYKKFGNESRLWREKIFNLIGNYDYIDRCNIEQYYDLICARDDVVLGLFHTINTRDYCTLYYIICKLEVNINYYFVVNNLLDCDINSSGIYEKNTYYSKKNLSDIIWRYNPIDSVLSTGDIKMWNILNMSKYKLNITSYQSAIIGGNLEIIQDLIYSYNVEITTSILLYVIRLDKLHILKLFLNVVGTEDLYETANNIFTDTMHGVYDWLSSNSQNNTLKYFIKIPIISSYIETKLIYCPDVYKNRWISYL